MPPLRQLQREFRFKRIILMELFHKFLESDPLSTVALRRLRPNQNFDSVAAGDGNTHLARFLRLETLIESK
jgi:hypothetical protein